MTDMYREYMDIGVSKHNAAIFAASAKVAKNSEIVYETLWHDRARTSELRERVMRGNVYDYENCFVPRGWDFVNI